MSVNLMTAYRLRIFILLDLLFIMIPALSQNYSIRRYDISDGLPHNNVRSLARDSSGFLWAGTWDGLSRFDGYDFKNYHHQPGDSTSLPFFSITDLVVDGSNNLWIYDDTRTISIYNRRLDNFKKIENLGGIKLTQTSGINTDYNGNLWIANGANIIVRDHKTGECKVYGFSKPDGKLPFNETIRVWLTIINDSLIGVVSSDLMEFKKNESDNFILTRRIPIKTVLPQEGIHFDLSERWSYYVTTDGDRWLMSTWGLFHYDKGEGAFTEFQGEVPLKNFTGKNYFYWNIRSSGLYVYYPQSGKLVHIPENRTRWVMSLISDGNDSFWFSSATSRGVALGISRVALIPGHFRNTIIFDPDSTLPAVYSIIPDKDNVLWTGIRGYDNIIRFMEGKSPDTTGKIPVKRILSASYIRSMIPVNNGIWIGHLGNLLRFYDYETGRYTIHNPEANSFRAIAARQDGKLYIGSYNLILYDPVTRNSEIIWQPQEKLGMFRVYADTNSGIIWGGASESRLLRFDQKSGKGEILRIVDGVTNIEDILPGENGELWLALLGKGVCRYNTVTGKSILYTTASGLSNNTTYSLLRDKEGNIWVSTNDGISRIDPVTGHIRTFNESDGIVISEFNSGAKFQKSNGEMIFGGMGGFVRFFPDSINTGTDAEKKRKILITSLKVSGEERNLSEPVNDADTIILQKGEYNFHLTFATTDFISPEKIIYRYRLSKVNKNWIETRPGNRNINYSNLRPGWYNLLIESTDHNGEWNVSRNITIRIKPLFYQTRIFLVLTPLLSVILLVFSIFIYIRQLKQKERSMQDELKLQSLRSQMNPHFIFNSLNSINYFISNNDKLSANRYIADFARLIRSILSNMGSNYIPLEEEINSLKDYLRIEHLRFGDKFDYRIDTSAVKNTGQFEVCPGLVQPLIENAIWHGIRPLESRKGQISINFIPLPESGLCCIIDDDGIGRTASIKNHETSMTGHKSRGIGIITERLQITGKLNRTFYSFELKDLYPGKKEPGTRVEIELPSRRKINSKV